MVSVGERGMAATYAAAELPEITVLGSSAGSGRALSGENGSPVASENAP